MVMTLVSIILPKCLKCCNDGMASLPRLLQSFFNFASGVIVELSKFLHLSIFKGKIRCTGSRLRTGLHSLSSYGTSMVGVTPEYMYIYELCAPVTNQQDMYSCFCSSWGLHGSTLPCIDSGTPYLLMHCTIKPEQSSH